MKQDKRGSWYLLTGAILGIAAGLIYSWVISPVEYVDAPPYALRASFKDDYRALIAAAYLYSNDLVRARDRLAQLKDDNPAQSLALQAQEAMAEGHPEEEVKALGLLTLALSQSVSPGDLPTLPVELISSSEPVQDITRAPLYPGTEHTPELTLQTTPADGNGMSTPAIVPDLVLQDKTLVCDLDQTQPLLQVVVRDANGQPIPSVELEVRWKDGEEHIFTGADAELSPGYADFLMIPDVAYSLSTANGKQVASDLATAECLNEDQSRYWGSWMLTFIQP